MPDPAVNPSAEEREPRFFRGLFLAFLVCAAAYVAAALLAGCATDPATGDVTVRVPAAAVDAATNAAARAIVAIREARESSSHSQAETTGKQESGDPAPAAETVPAAGPESLDGEAPPSPTLVFRFGGFDGSRAVEDPATQIGAFKFSSSGMSYKWTTGDLGNWGLAHTDAGALACAFYWSDKEQAWIGGKFDWISSSRLTRSWENVRERYNGWDPDAFFSAKRHAFCIVSKDGRKRTNLVED